jgi:DNA-binding transcriptional LysR family regulator
MAFRHARGPPRIAIEVHSVGVACSFVAQGLGVSIVNALLASYCTGMAFTTRPFRPRISYQLGMASIESSPSAALAGAFSGLLVDAVLDSPQAQAHTRRIAAGDHPG